MSFSIGHSLRLARWGRTLARHGALLGLEHDPLVPVPFRRLARLARVGARLPAKPRYADAFQAIGPAAIKLGQALATRPDLVGEAAANDLLRLQDRLPAVGFPAIRDSIEEAFDRPLEQLFAEIDPEPVGAASIAQVHRATTTDGREVAVKVLRPGIEREFERAIATFEWAAARMEALGGEAARLRPRAAIALFRRWTERELDLRLEAASASELADAFAPEPALFIPAVDWSRTSRRVLTLEWVNGVRLSQPEALPGMGVDRKALAATLVRSFLVQAVDRGFFHADLHQGNLFVLADGRLAIIDFGIMGRLDRRARIYLAEILHGLLTGNYARVAEIHFEAGYVPRHHDAGEFATALRAVGEPIRGLPVRDISIANLLDGLFAITRAFDMPTQPHLLLLQKTMVMVEGVALTLDPDVNMWELAEPFVREWMRDELGPEAVLADALVRNTRLLLGLPDVARRLIALLPPEDAAPPGLPIDIRRLPGPPLALLATIAALIGLFAGLSLALLLS